MLLRWARSFLKRARLVDSEFNNVSEGNATYTYPLLFQWAITIKFSLSNTDIIIISSNYIACSRHDRAENCSFGAKQQSLTHSRFLVIIMKRKFKQQTMIVNHLICINKTYIHLSHQEERTTKYGVRNPGLGLWHWQKCAAVKPINGIPTLSESFLVIGCFSSQYALNNYCTYDRFMLLRKQLCNI